MPDDVDKVMQKNIQERKKQDPDQLPEPVTQEPQKSLSRRLRRPAMFQEFPGWKVTPREDFGFIDKNELELILKDAPVDVKEEILADMHVLEIELLNRFFKERDFEATRHQNRYRRFQITYISLAFVATILGSAQAYAIAAWPEALTTIALMETVVALVATMVATISTSEPPFTEWIENRRIAEFLRQEYFRYLLRIDPYDGFAVKAKRDMFLARRAAEINSGKYPEVRVENEDND
jgi:hypothetical protein